MSVPFITAPALSPTAAPSPPGMPSRPTSTGFDAALAAETTSESTTAAKAEDLVGTRIRAPEGGCGCDALVVSSVPQDTMATSIAAPPASAAVLGSTDPASPARPGRLIAGDLVPGEIVLLRDQDDLSGRLHQAIVRNATEMIAANRSGMIEVLSIPWDRVAGVR